MAPVGPVYGPVTVTRIVDGDTVVVGSNVGPRTVRLIGIDAPEVSAGESFGLESTVGLEDLLQVGTPVWLELDLGLEDRYGRLLAYVYVADPQGSFLVAGRTARQVNLAMIHRGWARTMRIAPNVTYADLFEVAEAGARGEEAGLWQDTVPPGGAPLAGDAVPLDEGVIALHCALVNPDTPNDTAGEWVSVRLTEPLDTRGYYLRDEGSGSVFRMPSGVQPPGELRVGNPGQGVWNNGGDVIYLMLGAEVVDSWAYRSSEAVEGQVACRRP